MKRRDFVKAGAGGFVGTAWAAPPQALVIEPSFDPAARWAIDELIAALDARGIKNKIAANSGDFTIKFARTRNTHGSLAIKPGANGISVASADAQGLSWAVLELADQIRQTGSLERTHPIEERPANRIRSIIRPFVSEVEDKAWFYDRDHWREYLTMLATHRFNRFSLTFGIGYDFTREVRDSYFHFPYPFLVKVPGYDVNVPGVDDRERQLNLDTLRFIGEETVKRGMQFQVGIWTHAYNFDDSPNADRKITGLNPGNHAPYCRDALRAILEACPTIGGLTLRTHGESGVPEESYPFWKTVFEGVTAVKRPIELDLHAKGLDWPMVELTQATGMPVTISPKYWAEHMGLPYHQAAIRQLEMPKERAKGDFFALSSGSRSFLRYGYGDLLKEKRTYKVLHRMWPGTQRLLLWGDPVMAAAYSRASSFCGSDGVEICEPLSFKGRKGSGLSGGRTGYADASLVPARDWQKYSYTYRVWGRSLYSPDTDPEVFSREPIDKSLQQALAASSRILPLITTAHMPSAANANYWPEIYTNQSIVVQNGKDQYSDTPSPKCFGTVSPLDPEMFARIDEEAAPWKYSPIGVATWLDVLATESEKNLAAAKFASADERRVAIDVAIQNGIGRFFAAKFRSAVQFQAYIRTGNPDAKQQALEYYRAARAAWQTVVDRAASVYRNDLTFGYADWLRGSWKDRLPAIDRDIAAMEASQFPASAKAPEAPMQYLRHAPHILHEPVTRFRRGQPVVVTAESSSPITLRYRRVNQSETWQSLEMKAGKAEIPATYTNTEYPLQYYFIVGGTLMHPGLPRDFSHAPYFVIRGV
jgi:hypothetical protein